MSSVDLTLPLIKYALEVLDVLFLIYGRMSKNAKITVIFLTKNRS